MSVGGPATPGRGLLLRVLGAEAGARDLDEVGAVGQAVEDCYPSLIEAGKALAGHGVPFHDLTGLFVGHPEPLYEDACCDYNQEGKRLLAKTIGKTVVKALAESGKPSTPR